MGEKTGIEWTEKTYNPWQGCTRVSPGCAHCYMFREKERYGQDPSVVVRSRPATFNAPLKWKDPALVFTCSWSDFFHKDADQWRDEAWDIIRQTPHLTYQILTKRPERILDHLPADWGPTGWDNVWMGTSVENQRMAKVRIPELTNVPARVRFLSCEPLLGELDLRPYLGLCVGCQSCLDWADPDDPSCETLVQSPHRLAYSPIHWVIAGGESGPAHRPMDWQWVRRIRDDCRLVDVPFFLKQGAGLHPEKLPYLDGEQHKAFPTYGASQDLAEKARDKARGTMAQHNQPRETVTINGKVIRQGTLLDLWPGEAK